MGVPKTPGGNIGAEDIHLMWPPLTEEEEQAELEKLIAGLPARHTRILGKVQTVLNRRDWRTKGQILDAMLEFAQAEAFLQREDGALKKVRKRYVAALDELERARKAFLAIASPVDSGRLQHLQRSTTFDADIAEQRAIFDESSPQYKARHARIEEEFKNNPALTAMRNIVRRGRRFEHRLKQAGPKLDRRLYLAIKAAEQMLGSAAKDSRGGKWEKLTRAFYDAPARGLHAAIIKYRKYQKTC
jgi:hypothetical protein